MPLLVGAGKPEFGRWRRVGRYSSGSAPANQAIGAGPVFASLESAGVPISALQQNQALLIKRYTCSLSDPGNANGLFLAQPPLITLQVSPFGLTTAVLSWGSNVQVGVGVAGTDNSGLLCDRATIFTLENEWLEFDDYKAGYPVFSSLTTILLQQLKIFTDARVWNATGAGQNLRFAESLLYEIWQQAFAESPT
jgi:hypothetical protein